MFSRRSTVPAGYDFVGLRQHPSELPLEAHCQLVGVSSSRKGEGMSSTSHPFVSSPLLCGRSLVRALVIAFAVAGSTRSRADEPCGQWVPGFSRLNGTSDEVRASVVFDDGRGPALFVAGWFGEVDRVRASGVARWNGTAWESVGGGIAGRVNALVVFDDGSGPALYAGGEFDRAGTVAATGVARWDGARWSAVGSGLAGRVLCLAVHDDGTGHPKLIAGGRIRVVGDGLDGYVIQWDGDTWTTVGEGFLGGDGARVVNALATFTDSAGTFLLAGGRLTSTFGGTPIANLARWNGHSWSTFAGGTDDDVDALLAFDSGTGPSLYVAGRFSRAGGVPAAKIARWNRGSWSALGSGLDDAAYALGTFDDGGGRKLYAGGSFTAAGGSPANHVARWDGTRWSALGAGISRASVETVLTMTSFDDGSANRLFVGGVFGAVGNDLPAQNISLWDGRDWLPFDGAFDLFPRALAEFDDGTGPAIFAGGNGVAKLDHGSLIEIASAGFVYAMTTFDDGTGAALYVAGRFTSMGGVGANNVARWDGRRWSALGVGTSDPVSALAVHDDGTGPALYVGGSFDHAGGLTTGPIARWNGHAWSAVGSPLDREADALTSFDDGTGSALLAAGRLQAAPAGLRSVFRWDGRAWTDVGIPVELHGGTCTSLVGFDDGDGPALFAAGSFDSLEGGSPVLGVWRRSSWTDLTSRFAGGSGGIASLAAFDAGGGPRLYAGGSFSPGNPAVGTVARWNGSAWSGLDGGVGGSVYALLPSMAEADGAPGLVVAGDFSQAGGTVSARVAKWEVVPGRGSVNEGAGSIVDVLFVDDSTGGTERTVPVGLGRPIDVRLDAAPAGSRRGHYVMWVWDQAPRGSIELRVGGRSVGSTIAPSPFDAGRLPQPIVCFRGTGVRPRACRGGSEVSGPARVPWTIRAPRGRRVATTITLQGVIEDQASVRGIGVAVTNAVTLRIE